MVEDDSAVWPAVMIHKTQIREESYSNCLKTPLVTYSETIAIDLVRKERGKMMLHYVSNLFPVHFLSSGGCRKNGITAFSALNPSTNVVTSVSLVQNWGSERLNRPNNKFKV